MQVRPRALVALPSLLLAFTAAAPAAQAASVAAPDGLAAHPAPASVVTREAMEFIDLTPALAALVESLGVVEGPFDPRQGNFAVAGSAAYDLGLVRRGLTAKYTTGSFATQRMLLMWEDVAGPHTLPCSFTAVVPREVPQWRVQPDGLAKGEQKRRHVRASTDGVAHVVRDQAMHGARLLDVSEGGLRCRLDDADALVGVGDVISCSFKAGAKELDLRGRVLQVHLDLGEPRVLAVQFLDLTGHQSDELRRHVFAEQARARARTVR